MNIETRAAERLFLLRRVVFSERFGVLLHLLHEGRRMGDSDVGPVGHGEELYRGVSKPVNKKLSEILVQLHISEKSGRGVPRIVAECGKDAFEFAEDYIAVTIPFHRLDLGSTQTDTQVNTQVDTQVDTQVAVQAEMKTGKAIDQKILDFCEKPRSTKEITEMLGFKERKSAARYIRQLLMQGRIAMTVPDKPNSQNQKYITIL